VAARDGTRMRKTLACTISDETDGFSTCWIELGTYPLPETARQEYGTAFLRTLQAILQHRQLKAESYLQVSFLHHGAQWIPMQTSAPTLKPRQGLGVHPEKPPRQFTDEDIEALDPRTPFASFIDTVLHLTALDFVSTPDALLPHWGLGSTMLMAMSPSRKGVLDSISQGHRRDRRRPELQDLPVLCATAPHAERRDDRRRSAGESGARWRRVLLP
jgi:hypothetical protein